ncbi:hypothetical protein [Nakamurella lactea]|uniref:hypothetical protein n=1 Tax=Nakamurella lactea TaxID=459515 RepID=UPI0004237E45|nr:hypothetical protein [Nakamurella lactea]
MTSEAMRRLGGWVFVCLALVALLTAVRISGRDVPGAAVAVPPVSPPPAGTCLNLAGSQATVLPCDQRHSAEVIGAWPVGLAGQDSPCRWDDRQSVLGAVGEDWRPPPYSTFDHLVDGGGPTGWTACVQQAIATADPVGVVVHRGSLLSAASVADYPVSLRACYWQTAAKAAAHPVDCTQPHDAELLAVSNRPQTADNGCAALAVDLIGSAKVFDGPEPLTVGDLNLAATGRIVIDVENGRMDRHTQPFLTGAAFPAPPLSNCAVRVQPGKWLMTSVVGLGDAPLPYGGPG